MSIAPASALADAPASALANANALVELAVQRLRYGIRGTLAVRQGQGTLWEGA